MEAFLGMFFILCAFSALFTECMKRFYKESGKKYNYNIVAFITAGVVGGFGSTYWMLITGNFNWYFIPLAIFFVWMGSMVGYDKVIQTLKGGSEK